MTEEKKSCHPGLHRHLLSNREENRLLLLLKGSSRLGIDPRSLPGRPSLKDLLSLPGLHLPFLKKGPRFPFLKKRSLQKPR